MNTQGGQPREKRGPLDQKLAFFWRYVLKEIVKSRNNFEPSVSIDLTCLYFHFVGESKLLANIDFYHYVVQTVCQAVKHDEKAVSIDLRGFSPTPEDRHDCH